MSVNWYVCFFSCELLPQWFHQFGKCKLPRGNCSYLPSSIIMKSSIGIGVSRNREHMNVWIKYRIAIWRTFLLFCHLPIWNRYTKRALLTLVLEPEKCLCISLLGVNFEYLLLVRFNPVIIVNFFIVKCNIFPFAWRIWSSSMLPCPISS